MTSERNDQPSDNKSDGKPGENASDKPMGTALEPIPAAGAARSEARPAEPKPSDYKPTSSPATKAAATPPPPRPASAAPNATRAGMGLAGVAVVALIVSALVAGALVFFAPRWTPMLGMRATPPSATTAAPTQDPRVAELAARVEQLSARPAADPNQADGLRGQIGKLQEDLARLTREQNETSDQLAQVAGAMDDIKPAEGAANAEALSQRLARMEQQMADAAAALERLRAMRGELDAAVAQLTKLAQAETRIGALEKETAERRGIDAKATDAARAAAIVSLGTRVRQGVAQGTDSSADLTALKTLAGQDAELAEPIAALTPLAGKKLATAESLRQRFPVVAREIVAADATEQAGEWWEKALTRLQNLVSIRRTGPDVTGDNAEARVAQAEQALQAGRLDQAVAALKPLQGQAAKAAAPWLADAEAVLAAQAAADRIVARGATLLSQTAGAQPASR
jgi:hypothetical protein